MPAPQMPAAGLERHLVCRDTRVVRRALLALKQLVTRLEHLPRCGGVPVPCSRLDAARGSILVHLAAHSIDLKSNSMTTCPVHTHKTARADANVNETSDDGGPHGVRRDTK